MKSIINYANGLVLLGFFAFLPSAYSMSTLDGLKKMVNNHLTYLGKQQALELSQAQVLVKKASFLPTLALTANSNRDHEFNQSSFVTSGVVSLNVWRSGADLPALSAAKFNLQSTSQQLTSSKFTAERQSMSFLISAVLQEQKLKILQSTLENRQELFNIAEQRYKQGLIPLQQHIQAEVDLENAKAQLRDGQMAQKSRLAEIASLLGNSDIALDWPWQDYFKSSSAKNLLLKKLDKDTRPDFQALAINVQAQQELLTQSKRLFFPTVDLSVARNRTASGSYTQYDTSAQITLSIPLFEKLSDYGSYKEQVYNTALANYELNQMDRGIAADFVAKKYSYEQGLIRVQGWDKLVQKEEKNFRAFLLGFKQGRLNYQQLAQEQDRLNQTKLLAISGMEGLHLAYADYCHALGLSIFSCN